MVARVVGTVDGTEEEGKGLGLESCSARVMYIS
jgi:hypothetical protein